MNRRSPAFRRSRTPLLLWGFGLLLCISHPVLAQTPDDELALHQQRARQAEARQDFATAIREYRFLVQHVPSSPELESNLGVALYFHHDYTEAAAVLHRAIALKPALYAPHLFLGLSMAQLGHPDAAVAELEAAISLNSADPLAHTWLGYEYTAQSQFEKAAPQFELAAGQKPGDQDVWFALGHCYLELGKKATADLAASYPDGGRIWQLAAEQYEAQGNRDKALHFYLGAFQRRPDISALPAKIQSLGGTVPDAVPQSAGGHAREDTLFSAIEADELKSRAAFERISQIDPSSYRSHQVLAESHMAAEDFDAAITDFQEVLALNPNLPGIRGQLCDALSRVARLQDAIAQCDAELIISPSSSDAYVQAARVHLLANDDSRAAALVDRALRLDRPPIAAFKLLGRIQFAHGQYAESVASLRKYLAIEKNDASAYYILARAYKNAGNRQMMNQAIADYKRIAGFNRTRGQASSALDRDRADNDQMSPGEQTVNSQF